jgi:hypothetical protein
MGVQRRDIRRPDHDGGGTETRYWCPVNVPVLGHDRRLAYIIHQVEDVTDFVRGDASVDGDGALQPS